MTATAEIGRRSGRALGPWIAGPFVGALLILAVATQLRAPGCGASLTDQTLGVVFIMVTAVVAVIAFALGVWRLVSLVRRGGWTFSSKRPVLGSALLVAAAVVYLVARRDTGPLGAMLYLLFIAGLMVTVIAFGGLAVDWIRRRGADDAGVVLPAYLLGCSLCVYPLIFKIVSAITVGCWGE